MSRRRMVCCRRVWWPLISVILIQHQTHTGLTEANRATISAITSLLDGAVPFVFGGDDSVPIGP